MIERILYASRAGKVLALVTEDEYGVGVEWLPEVNSRLVFESRKAGSVHEITREVSRRLRRKEMSSKKGKEGKVKLSLVEPEFLIELAKVMEFGATKHGERSYQKDLIPSHQDYMDALYRHLLAILSGELIDKESGLYHHAHIAANAMIALNIVKRVRLSITDLDRHKKSLDLQDKRSISSIEEDINDE